MAGTAAREGYRDSKGKGEGSTEAVDLGPRGARVQPSHAEMCSRDEGREGEHTERAHFFPPRKGP